MAVERMGYIVYYRNKQVLKQLEKMQVNISFISKKMNYSIFYGEKNLSKTYFNQLRKIRGFIKLEEQPAFDEQLNFNVK